MPHECYATATLDELRRHLEAGASIYIKDPMRPVLTPLGDGRATGNLIIDYTTQMPTRKETKSND